MKSSFISKQLEFFKKLSSKDKMILLGASILLVVLMISLSGSGQSTDRDANGAQTQNTTLESTENYRRGLETQLTSTLESVEGVGSVSVMITLDGEISKDIAYNETSSANSSSDPSSRSSEQKTISKDAVMIKDGSVSTPYTIADKYPQVVGVVVVAEGGGSSSVQYSIMQAVKTSLNVPAHKIVVLPKKSN